MYKGFNVVINDKEEFQDYYEAGSSLFDKQKEFIRKNLEVYIKPDGYLSQEKMEGDWFPKTDAHVFLSHSHKDIDFVIAFAGWLKEKFDITAFIDSLIWGNADTLLRSIDEHYCVSSRYEDGSIKTFGYNLRNKSTSNVHMMLYTALMKMIDQTECLMFINTPSSIQWSDMLSQTSATLSPWIYGELLASKLIRNRSKIKHRQQIEKAYMEHVEESTGPDMEYNFNTKHLIDITDKDLLEFKEKAANKNKFDALDTLYRLTENKKRDSRFEYELK